MQKKLPAKGAFSVVGDQTGECMERIESAENTKIKWAAALHMRKERERREEFVAEGIRLTETAAASSWPLLFCLVTETALQDARVQAIVAVLEKRQCPVYLVSQAAYKKASATNTPQGILLVMKRKTVSLSSLRAKETPFLAVLDKVQDPGNAGTIIRTADAAGCTGIVALEGTVDLFSDKTVRSAMGSLFHLPIVVRATCAELLSYIEENRVSCFASVLDKEAVPYFSVDYRRPVAVVFGNEGNGVSGEIGDCMPHVFIPMAGQTESLNVGTAAAIILYEAFRQRYSMGDCQQR